MRTPRRTALPWVTFTGLAVLLACSGGSEPEARPNVLIIVMDTVRADHLGAYGYPRPLTPNLDALSSQSSRFTRARATAPWTLPSHASLFTGLYPSEHGLHSVLIDAMASVTPGGATQDNVLPMDPGLPTLAELLSRAGYQTAAFVANSHLQPVYGLSRGFDTWELVDGNADVVNERVFRWLEVAGQHSFFLFLNYMDAHNPYNPRPRPDLFEEPLPTTSASTMARLYLSILGKGRVPRGQLRLLIDLYDRGLANLDHELGQLFAHLRARGLWDDLLLVVTSDHGEYFGEHDLIAHSKDVYEPVMAIPLLIKTPGQREGRVRDDWVSLAQVPALVLEHTPGLAPESLGPTRSDGVIVAENYYTRLKDLLSPWGDRFRRIRQVLYEGDWKLIRSSDGEHELYYLVPDPGESRNVIGEQAPRAEAMMGTLARELGTDAFDGSEREPVTIPEEVSERLKALGYH